MLSELKKTCCQNSQRLPAAHCAGETSSRRIIKFKGPLRVLVRYLMWVISILESQPRGNMPSVNLIASPSTSRSPDGPHSFMALALVPGMDGPAVQRNIRTYTVRIKKKKIGREPRKHVSSMVWIPGPADAVGPLGKEQKTQTARPSSIPTQR